MRVYEAKLIYEATVFEVADLPLLRPELVYEYMKDVGGSPDAGGLLRHPPQPQKSPAGVALRLQSEPRLRPLPIHAKSSVPRSWEVPPV